MRDPDGNDDYRYEYVRPAARTPTAWLGAAAFFLAPASGALVFSVIVIALVLQEAQQRDFDDDSPEAIMVGGAALLGLMGAVLALGLGIGGLCQPKAGKVLAAMGVAISACVMLGVVALVIIGLLAG